MKKNLLGVLAVAALSAPMAASANGIVVLDFEGIGDLNPVGDYYNGAGPANKNYGISFSQETLALVDEDAGGSGQFANEPSPDTVMFFLLADGVFLNYAAGFSTSFSFSYSSNTDDASVTVWDDLNATGNLLATLPLSLQFNENCVGDPTGDFCNWTAVDVLFSGVAKSIGLAGEGNQVGFDDITFGSDVPRIPEPASLALLGLGLAGLGLARSRRG